MPEPAGQPSDREHAAPDLTGLPAELASSSKYEVVEKLGQGGMGTVWKARHAFLHSFVALKVLRSNAADAEGHDRFLKEMRAAGSLQHPRIVRALDAERVGDLLLLVMEYVDGVTLDRLVKMKGPLPVEVACRWAVEVAEGLQHAHEMDLVHRDIKPHNLILAAQTKEVKILDFGLARLPSDLVTSRWQTKDKVFLGTPEYVAPEQAMDAHSADIRADIYSLGATLFFLLSGWPPFRAESALEILVAHLQEAPPRVSEWREDVPAVLAAVVGQMLAKSPRDRFQTPAEVMAALLPFAAGMKKPAVVAVRSAPPLPEATPAPMAKSPPPPMEAAEAISPPTSGTPTVTRGRPGRTREKSTRGSYWTLLYVCAVLPVAGFLVFLMAVAVGDLIIAERVRRFVLPLTPDVQPVQPVAPAIVPIDIKLVAIPPGKFLMGSPNQEECRNDSEGPQHEVEITKEFSLGVYEVTQEQYEKVMGYNPSYFSAAGGGKNEVKGMDTSQFPVESVSWEDAVEFCRKLTEKERKEGKIGREQKYRLPMEAEWEYSCRGPGAFSYQVYHFGDSLWSRQANFGYNLKRTTMVGSYEKNRFGLHDMHGNVWEWCHDWYDKDYYAASPKRDPAGPSTGSLRVLRGGSWYDLGRSCRSADRSGYVPACRNQDLGFRAARVPSGE